MTLAAAFFYLFAALTVAAGFMVIAAKNPVHAVLFLILAFFNAAGLFVLLGAEFLAMILVLSVLFDMLARWVERRTLVWQTAGRRERAAARPETLAAAPAPA